MASSLLDIAAELGSEEEDEDFDEEAGGVISKRRDANGVNGGADDSSEEEDEDDDEEEAQKIREGFIVDDEEDDEERRARRRERKKRKEREEDEEQLEAEDLELIGQLPDEDVGRDTSQSKYKRLKRGHRKDRASEEPRGITDIFADEDDEILDARRPGRPVGDEFDDFIEDDEPMGDDQDGLLDDDAEIRRPGRKGFNLNQLQGLDEQDLEDLRAAFGDGTEYDWALAAQEEADELPESKEYQLKDFFEPSQLEERMLTDKDNEIRAIDVPERFQLAREPFDLESLDEEEAAALAKEESLWISALMLPKRRLDSDLVEPFQNAIAKVLQFMNVEDLEIPFIFQHRKDYLIHEDRENPGANGEPRAERLLNQTDLWEVFELDLKFKALTEKRKGLRKQYDDLHTTQDVSDPMFEEMLEEAVSIDEIQDCQDYLHFQYSSELKDVNMVQAMSSIQVNGDGETSRNGVQKRARTGRTIFEKIRASKVYNMVKAFGISADNFASNAATKSQRYYTEDPAERPDDMADSLLDPPVYTTGSQVLRAAKTMFVEELIANPRLRKLMRSTCYTAGVFDVIRTDKGARKITEDHPYYEFKYLRNQDLISIARRPELFLRMLKAEQEGLVNIKMRIEGFTGFRDGLYKYIESDNFSDVAEAWNAVRREALNEALNALSKVMARGVKESFKAECENNIGRLCRDKYLEKVDQAPFKPKGMLLGQTAQVLAMSNGRGSQSKDAICWAFVEADGRVSDHGKFVDLRLGNAERYQPDGKDVAAFCELVNRKAPDVIAVSGFTVDTRKLYKDLQDIADKHDLLGPQYEDENEHLKRDRLEIHIPNDEVARLYHTSDRAVSDHPGLPPLTRFCVGLARYMQSPLKEYAALGPAIKSIVFHPDQGILPEDKLTKWLDTAMVDIVNLVGVEVNEAVSDPYQANLLPYIAGLGPRKASHLLKIINMGAGHVTTREELATGRPDRNLYPAVGPKVWTNCASFLYIDYEMTDQEAEYLDATRVHPEDYDLGRKMAADALELDEEDVKHEQDEHGPQAVVRKLIRDEAQDKVNDLILEEYAEQLEQNFNQRKRATLETIRAELLQPYEELRRPYEMLSSEDIFTMFTGETNETLYEGQMVPVVIRRTFPDHIECKLDCGLEGGISESEFPPGVGGNAGPNGISPRDYFTINQIVQAKLTFLNRKQFTAQLSLREAELRKPSRKELDHTPGEWDAAQEAKDKQLAKEETENVSGRAQRVIKHPLFHNFNSSQAEQYLGSQGRGDIVIRPSSKGPDHLAVTWKVADNIYHHIDVLELDKDNEFSVGRTLKVGKYTYSDLDELIVNHVKAMAKKVDEMMADDKYKNSSKPATEQWLNTYAEANPKRSMYAFCVDPKHPTYFNLCHKAGLQASLGTWAVKVVPNAFELRKHAYPNMTALKNGFKLLFANEAAAKAKR